MRHTHHDHGWFRRFARPDHHDRHGPPHGPLHGPQHGARHGRHGHEGGRGLARFFAHGDLRLVILHLIAGKPSYGYEIIRAIEDRVAGAYSPSPGVIYPTLTLLEELGYVTVGQPGDSGRKLHEITPQGHAFLDANRPALEALLARMAAAGQAQAAEPPPLVVQAMENLKRAMHQRLSRAALSAEEARAMAATLDAAAAMERL